MKLIALSLTLVGICFLSNSYAMENKPMTFEAKLSEARRLIDESQSILNQKDRYLMTANFGSIENANAYAITEEGKAAHCLNQAQNLAFDVMNNGQVELETKYKAQVLYEELIKNNK
jgi:hypothetical protein